MKFLSMMLLIVSASAFSQEVFEIADRDRLGNVGFDHLAANDAGQFVAISKTKVWIGQMGSADLHVVHESRNTGWVLSDSFTQRFGNDTFFANIEIKGTRLAINQSGQFIAASNRTIWLGDVTSRAFTKIFEAERATQMQKALINDAGQFLVVSNQKVFVGDAASGEVTKLVDDVVGSVSHYDFYGSLTNLDAATGRTLVALNASGSFVVGSTRGFYTGSVRTRSISLAKEDLRLDVQQVYLDESGKYLVLGNGGIYSGVVSSR